MPVDEASRHRLYNKATEVLGEEEAETLMDHLPPGGWPNLATKQDLLELERRLHGYMWRSLLLVNFGLAGTVAAIAFTAAGLS